MFEPQAFCFIAVKLVKVSFPLQNDLIEDWNPLSFV